MKNAVLLFSALLLSISAYSQDIYYGAQGGLSLSNTTRGSSLNDPKIGFTIGVNGQYRMNDTWGIYTKLTFDQKGSAGESLSFITVPVMAQWHFGKNTRWYLQLGPYASYLLGAEDGKDRYNNLDFGVAYGIGVNIPIDRYNVIFIEDEANWGLADIRKSSSKSNSRGAKLTIGIRYMLDN